MRWAWLLLCLAALAPARAAAQGTPAEVTLDELLDLVRERSPSARALRAGVSVADAEVDLAGVYPNPELGYLFMGRFDGSNQAINGTQHQAWIDVPLLIAGQNDARRAAAAGAARAERAELEVSLLALEVEARRAFIGLLAAQERVARLASARGELDTLMGVVRERAGAGAQSRYDETRMALEIARVEADLATARADVVEAQTRLAALAGRPGWQPRADGRLEALRREAAGAATPPAVLAMEARVRAAELDVERAERERVPELRLGVGSYLTTDPDSSSLVAGLTIPLPIFDPGDAAVGRARAARDAAEEARVATEAGARARVTGMRAAVRARQVALERFESEALGRLPEIQAMAEASYRLGASGVFELLDTFGARFELELRRIELLEALALAEVELLLVTGR